MNTIFKVGQKVFCQCFGWGEVIKFDDKHPNPINVQFKHDIEGFNLAGELIDGCGRSLFFAEPQITPEMLNPPFDIKEGDLCYFWDGNGRVSVDRFVCKTDEGYYKSSVSVYDNCCKYPELPPHLKP